MRYYEVKIVHAVEFNSYIVRAASIPEAHDKALAASEAEAKIAGVEAAYMPKVKSVTEFCADGGVLM